MRALQVAVLVLLAALAVPSQAEPPPDAFCVILFEGFDDFRLFRTTVDQETTLEEREALFTQLDRDGDGKVTLPENAAFQRETMEVRNGTFADPAHHLTLRTGHYPAEVPTAPLHTAVWRQVGHTFHKQNHTQPWPVREPVDLETQQVREASFPALQEVQTVFLQGGDIPAPPPSRTNTVTPEYVVIRAPPGWVVTAISGSDYQGPVTLEPNSTEVDVPAFNTKSPYRMTFERRDLGNGTATAATMTVTQTVTATAPATGPRGSPAVAPALAVLALGAAAVALRRRWP